jgi:hypothetical protein
MTINKKTTAAFLGIGALVGTVGAISMQTHAQQAPISAQAAPQAQVQPAVATPVVTPASADKETADDLTKPDTDNITDSTDTATVDKPDQIQSGDKETNDGANNDGEQADGPNGHQDPAGTNVDHQDNGQE